MLSEESVSATPGRDALYVSLTIHIGACIALVWLSLIAGPAVRFKLTIVHAGTPEAVRKPHPIYTPVRTARTATDIPADVRKVVPRNAETSLVHRNDGGDHVDYTPTVIPSDVRAILDIDSGWKPATQPARADTNSLSLLIPLSEKPLPPPLEPPPGDLDVQPPVIRGQVEPAVVIKKTQPVYPALAKTARVEGIVVLEGTINPQGKVEKLHVVSGHPMLVDAAIEAVKKWRYRPAKLNGEIIFCPVHVQVQFLLEYPGE